jgi:hypothetical protein
LTQLQVVPQVDFHRGPSGHVLFSKELRLLPDLTRTLVEHGGPCKGAGVSGPLELRSRQDQPADVDGKCQRGEQHGKQQGRED